MNPPFSLPHPSTSVVAVEKGAPVGAVVVADLGLLPMGLAVVVILVVAAVAQGAAEVCPAVGVDLGVLVGGAQRHPFGVVVRLKD